MVLGIFIVFVGLLILLVNVGIIALPTSLWSIFYPLLIIIIGIYVLIAAKRGKEYGKWVVKKFQKDSPTGGEQQK